MRFIFTSYFQLIFRANIHEYYIKQEKFSADNHNDPVNQPGLLSEKQKYYRIFKKLNNIEKLQSSYSERKIEREREAINLIKMQTLSQANPPWLIYLLILMVLV